MKDEDARGMMKRRVHILQLRSGIVLIEANVIYLFNYNEYLYED